VQNGRLVVLAGDPPRALEEVRTLREDRDFVLTRHESHSARRLSTQVKFETLRREVSVALASATLSDFEARRADALVRIADHFGCARAVWVPPLSPRASPTPPSRTDGSALLDSVDAGQLRVVGAAHELELSSDMQRDLSVMRDVLAAAEDRHRAGLELERADAALQKAMNELSHVTRAITLGELAASIAHEVNQPLAAIVANATACLNWLAAEPPNLGPARLALEGLERDAERADQVLKRIRALLSRSAPEHTACQLAEVIGGVVPLVQPELSRAGIRLGVTLDADLPPVAGDFVQLQQVVINLLVNALEAMQMASESGQVIEIEARVQRHSAQRWVVVEVVDSGVGLGDDGGAKIFQPFHTTKPDGLGMGLSISRSIIERHRGKLSADNNAAGGATFRFELPCST